jgi:hypothetical protein
MLAACALIATASLTHPAMAAGDNCTALDGGVWLVRLERPGLQLTETWDIRQGFGTAPAFNNAVPDPYVTGADDPHSNTLTVCTVNPASGAAEISGLLQGGKIYSVRLTKNGKKAVVTGIELEAGWQGFALKLK